MFHKEGQKIILTALVFFVALFFLLDDLISIVWLKACIQVLLLILLILILQFFRNPKRHTSINDNHVVSPVDGKVVVIEEIFEDEYFKEKRIQVSIFMSPLNVHVTRFPIGGEVIYSKYHPGSYLVAWHPKASKENEHTTVVLKNNSIGKLLYRQIAGAVARRIVNYAKPKSTIIQGHDSGFIKFGSRVDLILPLDIEINVTLNQNVRGGESIIAKIHGK